MIVDYVTQIYTYRLNLSLQYIPESIADQRISTSNNTNDGPRKPTTQMLKSTANQKIRITIT